MAPDSSIGKPQNTDTFGVSGPAMIFKIDSCDAIQQELDQEKIQILEKALKRISSMGGQSAQIAGKALLETRLL